MHLNWHPINLPDAQAASLLKNPALKGFIHRSKNLLTDDHASRRSRGSQTSVVIYDWVERLNSSSETSYRANNIHQLYILAVGLPYHNPLDVTFMPWKTFRQAVISDPDALGQSWVKSGVDCFIGGADLQLDIRWALNTHHPIPQ
jgi:hypothetical protein